MRRKVIAPLGPSLLAGAALFIALIAVGIELIWLFDRRNRVEWLIAVPVGAALLAFLVVSRIESVRPAVSFTDLPNAARLTSMAAILLAVPLGLIQVFGSVGPPVTRYAGGDRIETATAVSAASYEQADAVVIVGAEAIADALAGGPLAAEVEGPLLLSYEGQLSEDTAREIERLGAGTAYLLGGEANLSATVVSDLQAAGVEVVRIAGANRYETAALVAERLGGTEIFLAGDEGWPDALSAAAVGARTGTPILLTPGDQLAPATAFTLAAGNVDRITAVGGTAVLSDAVLGAARELSQGTVERIAGADRYATSLELARLDGDPSTVWVATGRSFADALSAAPAAAKDGAPLVLVPGDYGEQRATSTAWLIDRAGELDRAVIVGGTAAVSPELRDAIRRG